MSDSKITKYEGEQRDVTWDGRLCIHIGECGRSEGELFVGGRDPWCQPDLGTAEDVQDVVERCPTGALVHLRKDGRVLETAPAENTVVVANHGPLYVRGDLAIEGAPDDAPGLRFRAALCRCGASKNKPFCDNSHEGTRFRDHGAVGARGPGFEAAGGTLTITPTKDGPFEVKGALTIVAASGRPAWRGTETWLCRCGQSKNKPFCDGAHRDAGFTSE
ncbi:MAG: CDGSH iron-sulfur domain-containing protein [Myxococcales bacterium]|nr:CDGSH iron-sulfur domain-containing protein [Myxococcales bacterium]